MGFRSIQKSVIRKSGRLIKDKTDQGIIEDILFSTLRERGLAITKKDVVISLTQQPKVLTLSVANKTLAGEIQALIGDILNTLNTKGGQQIKRLSVF